jgi:glucokinase
VVIGVDVGGTKVAVAAVSGAAARDVIEHPTDTTSEEAVLAGIEAAVREVGGEPEAVGVGVPSQIDFATGTVLSSVNIPLEGVPLREELSRRLGGVDVYVDNDANCAALAEAVLADTDHLLMLTLGTGVGGGIVIEGQIFRGATGLGAELGHVVIRADGPSCFGTCPNHGCIESLCSGQALERATGMSGRDAVAAAKAGDSDVLAAWDSLAKDLGVAIASMVNAFEPERLVIGGGLSRAADLFLDTACAEARGRALPRLFERVQIGLAQGGADAGVIGAGVLAERELRRTGNTARGTTTTEGDIRT